MTTSLASRSRGRPERHLAGAKARSSACKPQVFSFAWASPFSDGGHVVDGGAERRQTGFHYRGRRHAVSAVRHRRGGERDRATAGARAIVVSVAQSTSLFKRRGSFQPGDIVSLPYWVSYPSRPSAGPPSSSSDRADASPPAEASLLPSPARSRSFVHAFDPPGRATALGARGAVRVRPTDVYFIGARSTPTSSTTGSSPLAGAASPISRRVLISSTALARPTTRDRWRTA